MIQSVQATKEEKTYEQPAYYGILPANVRYDKRLTANAKLLYTELTVLTKKDGFCYATNDYFAQLYEVSKQSISTWISQLEKAEYINIIYIRNGATIKERKIYIAEPCVNANDSIFFDERIKKSLTNESKNLEPPVKENLKENNTRNNSTRYNNNLTDSDESVKPKKKNSKTPLFDYVREFTQDEKLIEILDKWLSFKLKSSRNFTLEQFKMQLENLSKFANGKTSTMIVKVASSYSAGYQALVYDNELEQQPRPTYQRNNQTFIDSIGGDTGERDYSTSAGEILPDGTVGF